MNKLLLSFFVSATLMNLSGCLSEPPEKIEEVIVAPSDRKLQVVGVDVGNATQSSINRALSNANLGFIKTLGKWEEIWSAGDTFKDPALIKLAYTEAKDLAYFKYDFTTEDDPTLVARLLVSIESQYGKPTSSEGDENTGLYELIWDMGDNLNIVLRRDNQGSKTSLTYFNLEKFGVLLLEKKIEKTRSDQSS